MFLPDPIKPFVATALLALYLPVPFYLILLHSLHGVWKRIGMLSYIFLLSAYAAMVIAVVKTHALWPWRGWVWPAAWGWLAVVPLAVAFGLAIYTYRSIEPGTLHLARQINPDKGRPLITDGILGRIRHPRYLMFTLIGVGNFLATGYPLVGISVFVTVVTFALVIWLEERELAAYFGEPFLDYKRRVPAFIPRVGVSRRRVS